MKTNYIPLKQLTIKLSLLLCALLLYAFTFAQQPVVITNRWTGENLVMFNGSPGLSKTAADTWILEDAGGGFVRLKHASTSVYLNVESGPLTAGSIQPGWFSAQWKLKPMDGYSQIISRWKNTYINNQNNRLDIGAIANDGWWSAQWKIGDRGAGPAPVPAGSPDAFTMLIGSDFQYPRTLDMFVSESDRKPIADAVLAKRLSSMRSLISQLGNVKGLIENGDLTEYGDEWALDKFKSWHSQLGVPTYPGLGNHDYANNVENTFENHAANSMVDYMVDWMLNNGIKSPDFERKTYYKFPEYVTETTGSLSYSFDIGNVHFVQMNLEPYYQRSWSNFSSTSAKRKTVTITSAINWLQKDLAFARNAGKVIVLLCHDPDEWWGNNDIASGKNSNNQTKSAQASQRYSTFKNILSTYNVAAVFAGHIHQSIGEVTGNETMSGPDGDQGWKDQAAVVSAPENHDYYTMSSSFKSQLYGNVPIIIDGSAITSKYLAVKFDGNKMTVSQVSNLNGTANVYTSKEYTVYNSRPATPLPIPSQDGGVTASGCGCPAQTFRTASDHSWAEFRLPAGAPGQTIKIEGGAYNHYVFPKCNRVTWTDLEFKCNASCTWQKTSGSWDADGLCTDSKSASPYVATGDK